MKSSYKTAVAALCVLSGAALAQNAKVDVLASYTPDYQNGGGGEFQVQKDATFNDATNILGQRMGRTGMASDIDNASFQSFCLERGESIAQNVRYTVNAFAVAGGNGGPYSTEDYDTGYGTALAQQVDYLGEATQWIYWQFRNGTLGSGADAYNYTGGAQVPGPNNDRSDDAFLLQNLLWALEGETGGGAPASKALAWWADALAAIGGPHDPTTTPWFYQVRVLNIFTTRMVGGVEEYSGWRQSQLTIVPLPTASGLAFVGLGALAIRRRRNG